MYEVDRVFDSIRAIINNVNPELDITNLLYQHHCEYLLSKVKVSSDLEKRIMIENKVNVIKLDLRYKICEKVFQELIANEIPFAVIKGAVLSKSTYNNAYIRKSNDVDLLVQRESIDQVKKMFFEEGFIQGYVTPEGIQDYTRNELLFYTLNTHQVAPFVKKLEKPINMYVKVDLNFNILWGEQKNKADMNYVLKYSENSEICGVTVKKLMKEMEFISLCLHHYKDMNSIYLLAIKGMKLSWFEDIYFYIKNQSLNEDLLKYICEKLNVTSYIYYCIYYTNCIFNDIELQNLLEKLEKNASKSLLTSFGLGDDEIYHWKVDFGERLLNLDIGKYFKTILSKDEYNKILLNGIFL